MNNIEIINSDCLEYMKTMKESTVDLTVTSPPYDTLRTYNGNIDQWTFDKFQEIAKELYRVTKEGGIVVWVVGDSTKNGSESGTSFRQALYFKEIGFSLYDTMIYQKQNYVPLTHRRYEQEFEYMFVLCKGTKPNTFNPIMIPCKWAGTESWGNVSFHKTNDSGLVSVGRTKIGDYKQHGNIFCYIPNRDKGTKGHPAPFPLQLAKDHITTWSNEGDLVFDCFLGSGTTGVACKELNRNFIGVELDATYYTIAKKRIERENNASRKEVYFNEYNDHTRPIKKGRLF